MNDAFAVLVAADQADAPPLEKVWPVDACGRGARIVDLVRSCRRRLRSGPSYSIPSVVDVPVIRYSPLVSELRMPCQARDRLDAHAVGVVIVDVRHRIDVPDQVVVRRGLDPNAVSSVAGEGSPVREQADVVAFHRHVRGRERDARISGSDQRKRPEDRAIRTLREIEPLGTMKIQGDDGRARKRRGRSRRRSSRYR